LAKPLDQSRQVQQVRDTQKRTPRTHDNLRLRSNEIRPLRRNRAYGLFIDLQEKTHAIPVVAFTHASELLSTKWMERMRDAYKTL
jgi:hypothetical protein